MPSSTRAAAIVDSRPAAAASDTRRDATSADMAPEEIMNCGSVASAPREAA